MIDSSSSDEIEEPAMLDDSLSLRPYGGTDLKNYRLENEQLRIEEDIDFIKVTG